VSAADLSELQRPNDRLRRRRAVNRGMELLAWLAGAVGVGILGVVVWSVAKRGASELNLDLLTKTPVPFAIGNVKQGLANAFAGSLVIVGLATVMALPVGILVAIYVNEFAPRAVRNGVGLVLDVLNGIPAIVIAIFVFGLLVVSHGQSGYAGAFALAVIMLPLVARATIEVLALVPSSLREASLGLGVPRWRTTLGIVLPQTVGGIVTGAVLAVRTGCRRDRAAALHVVACRQRHQLESGPRSPERAGCDLRAVGIPRSGRSCARLGGRARAAAVHPLCELDGPLARHA